MFGFPRNLVVAASAGTGKTYSLVGVLVHLVLGASRPEPIDPARIVATTFSRKAAAEIRARLAGALERLAARDPSAAYRTELAALGWNDKEIAYRARRAIERLPLAQIGTLHGYATTLVRAHALDAGLPPSFELADELEAATQAEEAIGRAVAAAAEDDPLAVHELVRAAGSVDRLVSELARVLSRLEEDGRGPGELAIAEGDAVLVERRMDELVEHARGLVEHQNEKFRDAARRVAGAMARAEIDGDELAVAVREFCELRRTSKVADPALGFFAFRDALPSAATNGERGAKLVRAWRMRHLFAERAVTVRAVLVASAREIRKARHREAVLAFGDVLRGARDLLRDHPHVAAEVGAGIDALLVDEFQDTSRVQRELVQLLWEQHPAARAPGTVPPLDRMRTTGLFVVGDRKQSIYAFRGADVGVFAELSVGLAGWRAREALGIEPNRVREPASPLAEFVSLRHNRRGEPELLAFANAFSRRRLAGSGKELFDIRYVPETEDLLVPPERARAERDGSWQPRTTWLRPALGKDPRSSRIDEAFVIAARVRAIVDDSAASQVAEPRVAEAIAQPPRLTVRGQRPTYRDIAVLAQTNEMLETTAYALAAYGIPHVVAGRGFYSAREVRDLMAMLTLLVRPRDRLALLEVLRGAWGGLSDRSLLGLTEPEKGLVDLDRWSEAPRRALVEPADAARLETIASIVKRLRRNVDRIPPGTLLREAVRELAFEETLVQLPRGVQRVANVRKLLRIADKDSGARALLDRLRAAADREAMETEAATFSDDDDAVRLLTVHASKGLDFPIVFVPEVAMDPPRADPSPFLVRVGTGDTPSVLSVVVADEAGRRVEPPSYTEARDTARARDRAERARLSYVAVTRAAEAMFLVGDRRRPKGGTSDAYEASVVAALEALSEDAGGPAVTGMSVEALPESSTKGIARATMSDVASEPPANDVVGAAASNVAGADASNVAATRDAVPDVTVDRLRPAWRALSIATVALQDFHHCARRFQLAHVLDLPERDLPPLAVATVPRDEPDALGVAAAGGLDPRTEGTLAHRVLEQIDASAFGSAGASTIASAVLAEEGIAIDDPAHARIVTRVGRFLRSAYARRIADEHAELLREHPFVLSLEDAANRTVALRGAIDLLVRWPDGSVDVVDFKRPRGQSPDPYAFQLDVYALAARAAFPEATDVRAGIVFLGGGNGEPRWRASFDPARVRASIAALGARLVEARWSEAFPRVAIATCKTIHCGYVGLCHPADPAVQLGLFGAAR